jgi:hypothetical protein
MRKSIIVVAALAAAFGGANAPGLAQKEAPQVRPVGKPISCVPLASIRSTKVVDNSTIDFTMAGGKMYRNSLPQSCPGLKFEDRFSYRTSIGQLCSVDIVRVLHDYGGRLTEGAGCGLGKFQPVEKVRPAN